MVHKSGKIQSIRIGSKNSCKKGSMSRACTPVLVGVVSPVSEIWLPFKNSQISLSRHGLYSPWSSKNLIDRNRLKKFMQVGIDVKCMHTDFGGRGLSGFGDIASFLQ